MKLYSCLFLSALFTSFSYSKANAQSTPTILGNMYHDTCDHINFTVFCDSAGRGGLLETSFGDGTKDSVNDRYGYYRGSHSYSSIGTYTIKHVLIVGGVRVDSVSYSYHKDGCGFIKGRLYHDVNSNCTFDAGDRYLYSATKLEVDSVTTPVDTITVWGTLSYKTYTPGINYSFKILSNENNFISSCPASGTINATSIVGGTVDAGDLGFECPSVSGFDVAVHSYVINPTSRFYTTLVVLNNNSCIAKSGTLKVTMDPRYYVSSAVPSGTVSGNVVTWNYTGLVDSIMYFEVYGDVSGTPLKRGDTIVTKIDNPWVAGDEDTTNNSYTSVDTIAVSWDPNEKSVMPKGNIAAGTRLTYTLSFENTGNAPAENIHILDTLSANLDVKSLQVVTSSHKVNVSVIKAGSLNILKFDLPGIHLLDSSHHGQCDGFVMFSINSKSGLTPGAKIDNQAGIYFDGNEVVMTNMVENAIEPTAVP
ncbi:MAG: DUF11 domain-containing protein, partial [Bacteroidetes bacterium]|nr:DUF11 domain-containing protein [Bacteroidota bacterium]